MPKDKMIHSEIGRTAIDEKVKMKLWAISGGRCEMCNRLLYTDLTFGRDGNFGELAHIHAVSIGGPRNRCDMRKEEKNDIENLMLLCEEHHHLIDSKSEDYGEGLLIDRKRKHEERIRSVTEIGEDKTCRIVTYFQNIDHQEEFYSERLFKDAVISAGMLPLQQPIINLHNGTCIRYYADKKAFLEKERELQTQFKIWFDAIIKTEESIAVFSLAPQPLLFRLGMLINDQYNSKVFQCHRTGHKWAWRNDTSKIEYRVRITHESESEKVALVIDLSAEVLDDRITNILGNDCTIYHLTVDTPTRTFVLNEQIQNDFVSAFRTVMEIIKNRRPAPAHIHLFPIIPNSLIIRAGMDYMPKADLPLVLYEQGAASQGFFETFMLGG